MQIWKLPMIIRIAVVTTAVPVVVLSCSAQTKKADRSSQTEQTANKMQTIKMPVNGMVCNACQSNVKKTIKAVEGVSDVEVDLEKKFAVFTFDPSKATMDQIQNAVSDKGYEVGTPQEVKK